MPAGERLQTALKRARDRYLATPERERGFAPDESIRRLSRLIGGYTAMAGAAIDCEMLLELPSLRPFFPIAPATAIVQGLVDAQILLDAGKVGQARATYSLAMSRAADPSVDLEPAFREQIKHNVAHAVAAIDARDGRASTLTIADELEKVPNHRANAWHARRSYYRMLGQIEKVRECQRRIELLQLRDGPQPLRSRQLSYRLTSVLVERRPDRPQELVFRDRGGGRAVPASSRGERSSRYCHYHRLRGEYDAALERLMAAMDVAKPGRHRDWHHIAAAHVELLTLLGRKDEAIAQASDYEAMCQADGDRPGPPRFGARSRSSLARRRAPGGGPRALRPGAANARGLRRWWRAARPLPRDSRAGGLAMDDRSGFDVLGRPFCRILPGRRKSGDSCAVRALDAKGHRG